MPSLNLKTKKLRYAQADLTAIAAALTLLDTICEYDTAIKASAEAAEGSLRAVEAHIWEQRKVKPAAVAKK